MDPVNKWLTTVILFMAATLAVLYYTAGSGRYTMITATSALYKNHAVIYVLDTKDGIVQAKLVDENELVFKDGRTKDNPSTIFDITPPNRYGYNR